jgi:hypothetical protein
VLRWRCLIKNAFDFDDAEKLPEIVQRKREHKSEMSKVVFLLVGILVVLVLIGGLLYYQHIRAENRVRYAELLREVNHAADGVALLEGRTHPESLRDRLNRYEADRFAPLPVEEKRRLEQETIRDEADAAQAKKMLPAARQRLRSLMIEAESIWPR